MTRALVLAALLAVAASAAEPTFVELHLPLPGDAVGRRVADGTSDAARRLIVAVVRRATGGRAERELHVFEIPRGGLPSPEPSQIVPVMEDVVAWTTADVRDEPGPELVFLTPGGLWSYSLEHAGYRDNVARLVECDLVYELPEPDDLDVFEYVLPGARGDTLIVPGRDGFSAWGPGTDGYVELTDFTGAARGTEFAAEGAAVRVRGRGGVSLTISDLDDSPLLDDRPMLFAPLLSSDDDYRAPALADVDGDGRLDVLYERDDAILVHLAGPAGFPPEPTRREPYPQYLSDEDGLQSLTLLDFDDDGDADLIARVDEEDSLFRNGIARALLLRNDGKRLFPAEVDQMLRFEANELRLAVHDVDGDGRRDLLVTTYETPSMTELVTGFQLRRTVLLYRADAGPRPFERRPTLKDEQVFDIDSLEDAIVRRRASHDLSGDGIADLVEIDLRGRVAVRRVLRERSFFGGESWSIERSPWRRFDRLGSIDDVQVTDLNQDGLGDVLTSTEDGLVVFVSRAGR